MDNSSTTPNNTATHRDDILVLYDSAFQAKNNLSRILTHEFAHEQFEHLSSEERNDYQDLNGWVLATSGKSKVWKNLNSHFVEPDGNYSPSEDYANNVEYFVFNQNKLKIVSPNAYGWLKEHYGDKLVKKEK